MILTTLIDDIPAENAADLNLISEHGLSLYLKTANRHILFDTGKSAAFIDNMAKMHLSVQDIDIVIISHGHYDHIGGLLDFIQQNSTAKIYLSKNIFQKFYMQIFHLKFALGDTTKLFSQIKNRTVLIDEFYQLTDNIYLLSNLNAPINRRFAVKAHGKITLDSFNHELILIVAKAAQLIVFTGCCHSGITNIMHKVMHKFPHYHNFIIVGGLHLREFPKLNLGHINFTEINSIVQMVENGQIHQIYTCHCTGRKPYAYLSQKLHDKLKYIGTGTSLRL